ncbi:MAG TPA: class I SAM-dependent methyltransferase [Gammaproteobacteria bacterium]|nr:class I SAM-dependent methyltransferase [Gammaproteobacteria bacterium]
MQLRESPFRALPCVSVADDAEVKDDLGRSCCPLCAATDSDDFFRDRRRSYQQCRHCRLVFVPPRYHLSPETEKAEYDLHRNDPHDPGYRRFLGRLFEPVRRRLPVGSRGLDFGCGPGPALALMFAEAGYPMSVYDPFYADVPQRLRQRYDFITATEVVEHLRRPGEELQRLWRLLEPGGLLGIMTKRVIDREAFAGWHYRRDPTHVCFFSDETFEWLAQCWGAGLEFVGNDVVILARR